MTDHFTIKLPREDGERHNERRQELGLSWLEYVNGQAPARDDCPDADEVRQIVRDEIRQSLEGRQR